MQAVLSNNSYFALFESVVAAMMFDKDPKIRQKGLQEVLGHTSKRNRMLKKEGDGKKGTTHKMRNTGQRRGSCLGQRKCQCL